MLTLTKAIQKLDPKESTATRQHNDTLVGANVTRSLSSALYFSPRSKYDVIYLPTMRIAKGALRSDKQARPRLSIKRFPANEVWSLADILQITLDLSITLNGAEIS